MFQVIQYDEVHVNTLGEVYVLNFDEANVKYYGVDGKLKKNIGRRGKGPGEFTFPVYFSVIENQLYILDVLTNKISVFDDQGNFLRQVTPPGRQISLAKGSGGWFYWSEDFIDQQTSSSVLKLANNDFLEPKELKPITDIGWSPGTNVNTSDGVSVLTFTPVSTHCLIKASPDGKKVYFADPTKINIQVYDGNTGKLTNTITDDSPRLPFDIEWADGKYDENKANGHVPPNLSKIVKRYPEFFPVIRALAFDPDGNLVVDCWRGRPDDNHHPIAFDAAGKSIPVKYSWETLRRFAGSALGFAYILMFEEDGEAGICKVPMAEVEKFVEDHPVTDWAHSRSISISD